MHCAHCLRGDAEAIDQSEKNIDTLLSQVSRIDGITFTGGEPTLNLPIIRYFLEQCKERKIPVCGFYIVTNGKEVADEFLHLLIDWYCYVMECGSDADYNGVALSKDEFHESVPIKNELKLRSLAFFREDKFNTFSKVGLINGGRAVSLVGYQKRALYPSEIEVEDCGDEVYVYGEIALSCKGNILGTCDYSFECEGSYTLCSVAEFSKYIKKKKEKSA